MATTRNYIAGKFALQLSGVNVGFVKSVEGGGISADVINEPSGPSPFMRKHIGQPRYEEFALQLGFNLDATVYDWIAAAWTGELRPRDGVIIATDYNLKSESEREFFHAIITEVTLPALDASSKEAAHLTIKFAPGSTRKRKGSGKILPDEGRPDQKLFLPSNFRLEIAGLDCTRVNRIESFTVKQAVVSDDIGVAREVGRALGRLDFPNLKFSLPESAAQAWYDWFEDFVVRGNNDDGTEKDGSLQLLSQDRKTELARVVFFNCGICRLGPEKAVANSDAIKRVTVELYCERMELQVGKKILDVAGRRNVPDVVSVAPVRPVHNGGGAAAGRSRLARRLKDLTVKTARS